MGLKQSDRFGRKPLVIIGFIGASLGTIWFAQIGATESAPPGLIAAAIGLVVGVGETFGGGVMPIVADVTARTYGLPSVLYVAAAGLALGICCFLIL